MPAGEQPGLERGQAAAAHVLDLRTDGDEPSEPGRRPVLDRQQRPGGGLTVTVDLPRCPEQD